LKARRVTAEKPTDTYGQDFHDYDQIGIELRCHRDGLTPAQGGLGRAGHFRRVVELLYGPQNKAKHFIWHPWAEWPNERIHQDEVLEDGTTRQQRYIGLSGAGGSGKTDLMAVYGLVSWLEAPEETLVLCTSTDLKASRLRIWGRIRAYFEALPKQWQTGRLIDSMGLIVSTNQDGRKLSDDSGISLIAGDKRKERDAIGKMIGAHNKRVIFLADELAELSEAILEAAYSNLATNPFFQMIAASNFKSRYDPFGQFVVPKRGWDSITVDDEEWETERGICLHFDGMKSPNVLSGRDEWPIYGSKQLAAHKKDLGDNTAGFWRMCRSFESPIGLDDAIYSEADLLAGKAYEKPVWLTKPVRLSSLDPSFTNGGDRAVQWFGSYGTAVGGVQTLCWDSFKVLREDVRKKDKSRDFQIAEQFRDNCIAEGISPKHAGLDSTGGGSPFLSIVRETWSPDVLGVDFSGAPSEMVVSVETARTAKQAYDRKVSELWYVGREFLKYGQLKGVVPELAREMKARRYETVKGVDGLKVRVETKADMKTRLLFSPDIADSAFVLLHLCRVRFGAVPGSGGKGINGSRSKFIELARQADRVYHTLYAVQD
jgi:hypothetical protein